MIVRRWTEWIGGDLTHVRSRSLVMNSAVYNEFIVHGSKHAVSLLNFDLWEAPTAWVWHESSESFPTMFLLVLCHAWYEQFNALHIRCSSEVRQKYWRHVILCTYIGWLRGWRRRAWRSRRSPADTTWPSTPRLLRPCIERMYPYCQTWTNSVYLDSYTLLVSFHNSSILRCTRCLTTWAVCWASLLNTIMQSYLTSKSAFLMYSRHLKFPVSIH